MEWNHNCIFTQGKNQSDVRKLDCKLHSSNELMILRFTQVYWRWFFEHILKISKAHSSIALTSKIRDLRKTMIIHMWLQIGLSFNWSVLQVGSHLRNKNWQVYFPEQLFFKKKKRRRTFLAKKGTIFKIKLTTSATAPQ